MEANLDLSTQQLYAVALLAVLHEKRGGTERTAELAIPVQLESWATTASSFEEAARLGMKHARELWPESQGWFGHTARVLQVKLTFELPKVEAEEMAQEERIM